MKSIRVYISIFCIVLTIGGCQNKAIKNDEVQIFRYNESANIQTLDPAFARNMAIIWPCNQLFNGLVQLDDSLHIKPDIAKKWRVSEDGKEYNFTLRNDVYFHKHINFGKDSTRTVVAGDFEYSFNRLLSPQVASPGAWILQKVESFKALNDSVFQIRLKEPFPAFLGLLSMRYASVLPSEIVEDPLHVFRSHPIGTGPFYFKFWEENIKLVLRKNLLYFEKDEEGVQLPYLESVAITFLPDKQSAFLQFIQGNIDFISGLDPSYKDDIITETGELKEKYLSKIKMITGSYLNTEYLGINFEGDSPLGDKLVRRALDIGFDRQKMLRYLRNGMGDGSVGGMIPKGLNGNFDGFKQYDKVEAQKLVQQYKEKTNTKQVNVTLSINDSYADIAEYLQREWQKIGIDVTVDISPPSALRQGIASGKAAFFRGSWIADYPDAENYLSLFFSKNIPPQGPNYTRFSNAEFDKLYQLSYSENDFAKRTELYTQMDSIIADELPIIVLFYDKAIRFYQKDITGLGINPMNNLFIKKVKKTK
ncbi:ABC transporter substrate-binding protein [Myroides indicus]|uniref:Peptide/nickel transport system substrate-binding protein n=1 Tax=Myroides indicus TaxID=1323422 RepID=A0A4R7F2Y3_9FLAO|nr:ABC transporter substrate-binding protein [Myroides indicus]TDS64296.1 peptide/nickel transport system substrate-binding protein [Myroides indicus]